MSYEREGRNTSEIIKECQTIVEKKISLIHIIEDELESLKEIDSVINSLKCDEDDNEDSIGILIIHNKDEINYFLEKDVLLDIKQIVLKRMDVVLKKSLSELDVYIKELLCVDQWKNK